MKKRILVVEDNYEIRKAILYILRTKDYDVDEAADGKIALKKFKSFKPDLVLLDLMLPEIDGWTVYDKICNFTKVVFTTALRMDDDEVKRPFEGLDNKSCCTVKVTKDNYIQKPFDMDDLLKLIEKNL